MKTPLRNDRPPPQRLPLILTCEHGGSHVPRRYQSLFARAGALLRTHRGYDIGSLWLARSLAAALGSPIVASTVSRLLVDLNRSPEHPKVFSPLARALSARQRLEILARYYHPYRERVRRLVRSTSRAASLCAGRGGRPAVHVAVHTFTPRLRGAVRRAGIGLLHDPSRREEAALCRAWRRAIRRLDPRLRVRFNYPYRGWTDGLTTTLRKLHGPESYLGIELEVNQRLLRKIDARARRVARTLRDSLLEVLEKQR